MERNKIIKIILISLFISFNAQAKEKESYYQKKYCSAIGGVKEVVLRDRTRVDCLSIEYAIEIDFAYKWAECIGQSLYYSVLINEEKQFKTKPKCLLIVGDNDDRFVDRARKVSDAYNIDLGIIEE
jgi:hypothetical protein